MKFIAAALVLATSALAAPSTEKRDACTFGTYQCTTPNTGIEICDISGNWELVGPCPSGTACEDLPQNGFELPFCTTTAAAAPKVKARHGGNHGPKPGDKCTVPGKYQCLGTKAIQVCDTSDVLEFVGNCPANSHCDYINNIPYCVNN